jgi:hypothetical protein
VEQDDLISTADSALIVKASELLAQVPHPITQEFKVPGFYTKDRAIQQRLTRQIRRDARVSFCLALAATLSGNHKFSFKAKEFLFAWVRNLGPPIDGGSFWQRITLEHRGDTPLVIAYSFPLFINTFDLLQGEHNLSDEEVREFQAWLKVYVNYHLEEVFYKNNHHNWQVVFLMSAAHALEDPALFERAVGYYKNGLRSQIAADGSLPREVIRQEKAGTYTLMALEAMVQAVHLGEIHGHPELRDLASDQGATLRDAIRFYQGYLSNPSDWIKHTNAERLNLPEDPSDWGYVFELPYRWWRDPAYEPFMRKRPYGFEVPRCYTMEWATLLFGRRSSPAPSPNSGQGEVTRKSH